MNNKVRLDKGGGGRGGGKEMIRDTFWAYIYVCTRKIKSEEEQIHIRFLWGSGEEFERVYSNQAHIASWTRSAGRAKKMNMDISFGTQEKIVHIALWTNLAARAKRRENFHQGIVLPTLSRMKKKKEKKQEENKREPPFNHSTHTHTGWPSACFLGRVAFSRWKRGNGFSEQICICGTHCKHHLVKWSEDYLMCALARRKGYEYSRSSIAWFLPRNLHTHDNYQRKIPWGYPYHPKIWIRYLVRTQCINAWYHGWANLFVVSSHTSSIGLLGKSYCLRFKFPEWWN